MKKIICLVFLLASNAWGAGVVSYDINTNRIFRYDRTDEVPYIGKSGFIILDEKTSPTMLDFEAMQKVTPLFYFKVNNSGHIVEMSQQEKFNVDDQNKFNVSKEKKKQSFGRYNNDPVIKALVQIIAEIKGVSVQEIDNQVKKIIEQNN